MNNIFSDFSAVTPLPGASPSVFQGAGIYQTFCAGMPSPDGCGEHIATFDPATQPGPWDVGLSNGKTWLVTYGWDGEGDDKSYVLAFCPACAEVVKAQEILFLGEVPC